MIEVLTLSDKEKWSGYLQKMPLLLQDVYYSPEYYEIYETNGFGKAFCYVLNVEDKIALYPFLSNDISSFRYNLDKKYYDLEGAYGYNGILTNNYDDAFFNLFKLNFCNYCNEKNIVAEFTRFNPVLQNHLKPFHLEVLYNNENIVLNLTSNNIKNNEYEYSVRKNVNKALRNNLTSIIIDPASMTEEYLSLFTDIYYKTMSRNNAENYYYFPLAYFRQLISNLPSNSRFYFIQFEGKVISAELVLFGSQIAYSFLGGTLHEYYDFRPNDLLKDTIINNLKEDGKYFYCLGGGSEGIIRYKKKFSKNGSCDFFIGRKIYNQLIYDEIVNQWKKKNPVSCQTHSNLLLKYRVKDF